VIALFAVIVYRAMMLGQRAMRAGLPFQGLSQAASASRSACRRSSTSA
jgi:hypothetical protein